MASKKLRHNSPLSCSKGVIDEKETDTREGSTQIVSHQVGSQLLPDSPPSPSPSPSPALPYSHSLPHHTTWSDTETTQLLDFLLQPSNYELFHSAKKARLHAQAATEIPLEKTAAQIKNRLDELKAMFTGVNRNMGSTGFGVRDDDKQETIKGKMHHIQTVFLNANRSLSLPHLELNEATCPQFEKCKMLFSRTWTANPSVIFSTQPPQDRVKGIDKLPKREGGCYVIDLIDIFDNDDEDECSNNDEVESESSKQPTKAGWRASIVDVLAESVRNKKQHNDNMLQYLTKREENERVYRQQQYTTRMEELKLEARRLDLMEAQARHDSKKRYMDFEDE
jgi:hypothetical protein